MGGVILRQLPRRLRPAFKALRNQRGQALVEAALVIPILLLLLLALIESGNGLSVKHKMAVLSREGANIASRGSTLQETLDAVMDSGAEIKLRENGGAIVSRIVVTAGAPVVSNQLAYPGFEGDSRLGLPDSTAAPLGGIPFGEGQVLYAVEILFDYKPLTPVGEMLPTGFADEVYERAIF